MTTVRINNIEFSKEELLDLTKNSSQNLAAILTHNRANIELEAAQIIIENLVSNPNFYDNDHQQTGTQINILSINDIPIDLSSLLDVIYNDSKINAVKRLKDKTNIGLKHCKDIVDNLAKTPIYYVHQNNKLYFNNVNVENNNDNCDGTTQNQITAHYDSVINRPKSNFKAHILLVILLVASLLAVLLLVK